MKIYLRFLKTNNKVIETIGPGDINKNIIAKANTIGSTSFPIVIIKYMA